MQTTAADVKPAVPGSELDFLDLLIVLAKHKKLIIGLPLAVGAIVAAISLLLPNVYKATTKILPPQQAQSSAAALMAQLGGVAAAVGGSAMKNPNDLHIGMLRSRAVADKLVQKFDLRKAFDTESLEKARRLLAQNTMVAAGKDGMIVIDVESEDRKLAVGLANGYVEQLVQLNKVLAVTEAAKRRLFFEGQLVISKNNLEAAEKQLKGGLDARGVTSVDANSRAIVETISGLRARISAKDIELNAMQAFVTANNHDHKQVREELRSLRSELHKLENGRGAGPAPAAGTRAGPDNVKLLRDLRYHQTLFEMLSKQYELARLDEAKDASIIQVLDAAVEPEHKVKPRRAALVLVATVLAFAAAVTWAFLVEILANALRQPRRAAKWAALRALLRLG
ncbi:GumC family protein [Massilia glaciei]|uniref:Lipopolysaccharide biosynthesis protein n=1 Tax=Massilia glaciei TaxID=1524097 RepID=A0A2U2HN64_9BURK|nr:Wzz/FepE/Etk N-terminal domain-containing protein [Massilia glaciei]PWF48943.1 lipopolysaccharide biosynthesis protein [Massilia glaciei]